MAAGTVTVEDPEGALRSPVILDLVIDLAAPFPRIAAMRDISGLEVGVRILERSGTTDVPGADRMGGDDREVPVRFADGEASFDRPGLMEDFESVFDDESGFTGGSGFTVRESVFGGEGAFDDDPPPGDEPSPDGPARRSGPTGRWSPR